MYIAYVYVYTHVMIHRITSYCGLWVQNINILSLDNHWKVHKGTQRDLYIDTYFVIYNSKAWQQAGCTVA